MSINNQRCSSILPLTPIMEKRESDISENSMMEEKDGVEECKPDNCFSTPIDQWSLGPMMSVSGNGSFSDVPRNSSDSTEAPLTPYEVLRERLSKIQKEYDYLNSEYEELREFTKLEKQMYDEDCISKVKIQEENESLKKKNASLQEELNQNKIERETLEANLIILAESAQTNENLQVKIQEENESLKKKNASLQEELNRNKIERETLEANLITLAESAQTNENLQVKIQEENEAFKKKNASLQEELNQNKIERENLEAKMSSFAESRQNNENLLTPLQTDAPPGRSTDLVPRRRSPRLLEKVSPCYRET